MKSIIGSDVSIELKISTSERIIITGDRDRLQRLAIRWNKILRNRHRWSRNGGYADSRIQAALELTDEFPVLNEPETIRKLAAAPIIEVTLPDFTDEATDWSLRIMPWEFLITATTRKQRRISGQTVIRILPVPNHPVRNLGQTEQLSPLIIQSTPGNLDGIYHFETERQLIELNLRLDDIYEFLVIDPTKDELVSEIQADSPHLIHFTGFDSHQGSRILGEPFDASRKDGFYLSNNMGQEFSFDAEQMAKLITSAKIKPVLVNFNVYNSASRLCPLALSQGAGAAIGFQDDIDDLLAESFYAALYRIWASADHYNLLTAFMYAMKEVKQMGLEENLKGSGIVLWSCQTLIDQAADNNAQLEKIKQDGINQKKTKIRFTSEESDSSTGTGDSWGRDILSFNIEPLDRLNYSILHNNGSLFKNFIITKTEEGTLANVFIEVMLYIGSTMFPYRGTVTLEHTNFPVDIADKIRIPLGWEKLRSLSESIRSTMFVRVAFPWDRDSSVFEETFTVEIATLEEWSDTDADRQWLPSFIQPRDQSVVKAVAHARRYLVALTDDPNMGFDGYQSYDPDAVDPSELIDHQVRAIWTTILLEHQLQYINPPPSFYKQSQRVRSPSEVVAKKHGTCIDLTLIVASCLEYIEIHPVVFLIEGHAFPGYWRNEEDRYHFIEGLSIEHDMNELDVAKIGESSAPWIFNSEDYMRIIEYTQSGSLVPLESVYLTQGFGFYEACDAGIENLNVRGDFHSMQDIRLSRTARNNVTPIPTMEN